MKPMKLSSQKLPDEELSYNEWMKYIYSEMGKTKQSSKPVSATPVYGV